MVHILVFLFHLVISLFKSDKNIYIENLLLKKENQILKRKINLQRIRINRVDKFIFVILNLIGNIKNKISIVSPRTLLNWQNKLIKSFWTFKQMDSHPGRRPVPAEMKNLILGDKK